MTEELLIVPSYFLTKEVSSRNVHGGSMVVLPSKPKHCSYFAIWHAFYPNQLYNMTLLSRATVVFLEICALNFRGVGAWGELRSLAAFGVPLFFFLRRFDLGQGFRFNHVQPELSARDTWIRCWSHGRHVSSTAGQGTLMLERKVNSQSTVCTLTQRLKN